MDDCRRAIDVEDPICQEVRPTRLYQVMRSDGSKELLELEAAPELDGTAVRWMPPERRHVAAENLRRHGEQSLVVTDDLHDERRSGLQPMVCHFDLGATGGQIHQRDDGAVLQPDVIEARQFRWTKPGIGTAIVVLSSGRAVPGMEQRWFWPRQFGGRW